MKKIILTFAFVGYSLLQAAMFNYNHDTRARYEFNNAIENENEALASKLESFQKGVVTPEQIQAYLDANVTSELYSKDVDIHYSDAQMKEFNKTQADINAMREEEPKDWLIRLVEFMKAQIENLSKKEGDTNEL